MAQMTAKKSRDNPAIVGSLMVLTTVTPATQVSPSVPVARTKTVLTLMALIKLTRLRFVPKMENVIAGPVVFNH